MDMEDKIVTKSVSMPEDLVTAAMAQAAAQGRSWSNYLRWLVSQDLERSRAAEKAKLEEREVTA